MNYRCLEAVHPRGPAERAHEHYYPLLLSLSFFFLLLSLFSMHILCPEVVHPCGLAEGAHYHYSVHVQRLEMGVQFGTSVSGPSEVTSSIQGTLKEEEDA